MGGTTRAQRRDGGGEFPVYPADDSRGWGVIRMVAFAFGVDKVADGLWNLMEDRYGDPWYFQIRANFKVDQELAEGEPSPTAITEHESELNAGCGGKSETAWMSMNDPRRLSRHAEYDDRKPLPPEDDVELAQAKVRLWPYPASRIDNGKGKAVYGDRAVRVYPKR